MSSKQGTLNKPRAYKSAVREKQAEATRKSIADAAESLLREKGYIGMTVSAVARMAGVAPQTVYAVYGSKIGIITELMERVPADESSVELCTRVMCEDNPRLALQLLASLVSRIFSKHSRLMMQLQGTAATAPEVGQLILERVLYRREQQTHFVKRLYDAGHIRADYDCETAVDVLWSLCIHEHYYTLVELRGWPVERYEVWLSELLEKSLLRAFYT